MRYRWRADRAVAAAASAPNRTDSPHAGRWTVKQTEAHRFSALQAEIPVRA